MSDSVKKYRFLNPCDPRNWAVAVLVFASFAIGHTYALRNAVPAVIPIVIDEANLGFRARLDTGAEVSSINAIDITVIGSEGRPTRRDVGRQVEFTVLNEAGERARISATIAGIHAIRTADCREFRYHVFLTVRHWDHTQRVLMNLNNRAQSAEKLLLGRNWLEEGYLVDATR